jgi:hypothetical protein
MQHILYIPSITLSTDIEGIEIVLQQEIKLRNRDYSSSYVNKYVIGSYDEPFQIQLKDKSLKMQPSKKFIS